MSLWVFNGKGKYANTPGGLLLIADMPDSFTLLDSNENSATGYYGIPDASNPGSRTITKTPYTTQLTVDNIYVSASAQVTQYFSLADPSAFRCMFTFETSKKVTYETHTITLSDSSFYPYEGTDINIYLVNTTSYLSLDSFSAFGNGSELSITVIYPNFPILYDVLHTIEIRVSSLYAYIYIDGVAVAYATMPTANVFSGIDRIDFFGYSYSAETYMSIPMLCVVGITDPTTGYTTSDAGFDPKDVVSVDTGGEIIVKTGLAAQVTTISDIAAGADITGGDYFLISSTSQDYYVWYKVDDVGDDPAPTGLFIEGILVVILSTDTANEVAIKTATAIGGVT